MNGMLMQFLNFLLIGIEAFSCYLFGSIFSKCKTGRNKLCISGLLLLAVEIAALAFANGNVLVKTGLIIAIYMFWLMFLFGMGPIKALFVATLYDSILLAVDFAFILVFNAWDHHSDAYLTNPYVYYLFCYSVKAIELLLICILRSFSKKRKYPDFHFWQGPLRTIMFPLMAAILVITLVHVYTTTQTAAPALLLCAVILIGVDALAIALLNYLERQYQALQDYAILRRTIQSEKDNAVAWMNAYSSQRRQTHDFQNHLVVIRGLIEQEAPTEDLEQYVSQLLQTDFTDSLYVKTGRPVVDAILNQKHALAQHQNIKLKVQLDDLREFGLTDDDLVIVLANLIDNAINACAKVSDLEHRVISLTMRTLPEVSFLFIENPTVDPVIIKNNQVVPQKHSWEHGYGLKNVAMVLQQYNAVYDINYDEISMIFRFSAQIEPQGN